MTARSLFYLCEVGARLDSGMTLQVVRDYGGLARTGWRVGVPLTVSDEREWSAFRRFLEDHGELEAVPLRSPFRIARRALLSFKALRQRARVIVIRERRHWAAARLLRRLTGAVLVSELHEGAFPRDDREPGKRRFARFLASLDGIIFTNASQRDYLSQLDFALPRQQIVLPNGVDCALFSSARRATAQPPYTLTYAGQFTGWKNFDLLFAALARLDGRFRLRVAGGKAGAESARQVAELAQRFNVVGRVDYAGFIHPAELVPRVLDGSSVLLLPLGENTVSRHATSPMKLIEYLATGISVVAVGHPSVVALAGRDVVHLSSSDPDAFAAAIRTAVAEDDASRQARARKAQALAARFDHARRAEQFDAWLSQLLRP